MIARHLFAIAALPFTVTVAVPMWLAWGRPAAAASAGVLPPLLMQAIGAVLLGVGLLLFVASLRRFAIEGQGTLAPWDPPRRLVVAGPYRWVRNPMISGVIFILFGEAFLLRSARHAWWAAACLVINAVYIPLIEEPRLEARFGDEYRVYCRHVGRLLPRLRPWCEEERC